MKHYSYGFAKVFIFIICFLYLLSNPFQAAYHCKKGLELCADTAIPSLFIFIIFSAILSAMLNNISIPSIKLFKVGKAKLNPLLFPAVLLGMLCGAIPACVAMSKLYKSGSLSKAECDNTMLLFLGCSASFIITVCGAVLGDLKLACFILISNYLASFTAFFILCQKNSVSTFSFEQTKVNNPKILSVFTESISSAVSICLNMCSFIVFFTIVSGIASDLIKSLLTNSNFLSALICGFCEVTKGITSTALLSGNEKLLLIAAMTGFSGLSIQMQVSDILSKNGLSSKKYIQSRILCMLLCPLYLILLLVVLPYDIMCFSDNTAYFTLSEANNTSAYTNVFFIIMSFATAIVFIFIDKYHKKNG